MMKFSFHVFSNDIIRYQFNTNDIMRYQIDTLLFPVFAGSGTDWGSSFWISTLKCVLIWIISCSFSEKDLLQYLHLYNLSFMFHKWWNFFFQVFSNDIIRYQFDKNDIIRYQIDTLLFLIISRLNLLPFIDKNSNC